MFYNQDADRLNIGNHERLEPSADVMLTNRIYWSMLYDQAENAKFYREMHRLDLNLRQAY